MTSLAEVGKSHSLNDWDDTGAWSIRTVYLRKVLEIAKRSELGLPFEDKVMYEPGQGNLFQRLVQALGED